MTTDPGNNAASARLPLALVAAMSRNRVIGKDGELPWHEPEDLKHFKAITLGHAVIMGRKTADALKRRPLPKRRNLVITRQSGLELPGFTVVGSLAEALRLARADDTEPRVIGGGEIYAQALPLATVIHLTVVDCEVAGDAFFPEIPVGQWRERESRTSGRLVFRTFERI